jgi:hypothetical protein
MAKNAKNTMGLNELLEIVQKSIPDNGLDTGAGDCIDENMKIMISIMKKYRFYPAIKVKKYFDNSGLVLLYNSYKRGGVEAFQQLFNECRSVVLDIRNLKEANVVVSLAQVTPIRISAEAASATVAHGTFEAVTFNVAYEGTTVYVYEFNGKWYFSTSTSPTINSSRYHDPEKTHGDMLDDALKRMFPANATAEAADVRKSLTDTLDKNKAYGFIIVHHKNTYYTDYSQEFGENYAELIHMHTRSRGGPGNMSVDDLTDQPLASIGIRYAKSFETMDAALEHVHGETPSFGVIATTSDGKLFKITKEAQLLREEFDIGHPNKWHNMLWVYMKNRADFKIKRYIEEFSPDFNDPRAVTSRGKPLDPTYLIHTVMMTMADILFNLYAETTMYDASTRRYERNVDKDSALPAKIRFHLAILRQYQITYHASSMIYQRVVYHHLTHHCTIHDVKSLIALFASEDHSDFVSHLRPMHLETFTILNKLLG